MIRYVLLRALEMLHNPCDEDVAGIETAIAEALLNGWEFAIASSRCSDELYSSCESVAAIASTPSATALQTCKLNEDESGANAFGGVLPHGQSAR